MLRSCSRLMVATSAMACPTRISAGRKAPWPASCAAIMTIMRMAVATRPNSAQPAQSIVSAARWLAGLCCERAEYVGKRIVEARDALLLKGAADIVHVDTHPGQLLHRLGCAGAAGVDCALHNPVVLERGNGRLGQCIHGVG